MTLATLTNNNSLIEMNSPVKALRALFEYDPLKAFKDAQAEQAAFFENIRKSSEINLNPPGFVKAIDEINKRNQAFNDEIKKWRQLANPFYDYHTRHTSDTATDTPATPPKDSLTEWSKDDQHAYEVAKLKKQLAQAQDELLIQQSKLKTKTQNYNKIYARYKRADEKVTELEQQLKNLSIKQSTKDDVLSFHQTPLTIVFLSVWEELYTKRIKAGETLSKQYALMLEMQEHAQKMGVDLTENQAKSFDSMLRPPALKKNRGFSYTITNKGKIKEPHKPKKAKNTRQTSQL